MAIQPALVSFIRDDGEYSAEYLVLDGGATVTIPEGWSGAAVRPVPVWPQDYPAAENGWGGGGGCGTSGAVTVKPGGLT